MNRKVKKLFLSVFLGFYLLLSTNIPQVFAQEDVWYDSNFWGSSGFYSKVHDPSNENEIFGERYTVAQVQWIIYGFMSFISNQIIPGDREVSYCIISNYEPPTRLQPLSGGLNLSGLLTCMGQLTASREENSTHYASNYEGVLESEFLHQITSSPVSTIAYFKDIKTRLHLVPEAQAQTGFGFSAAEPVINLWRAVRNVTYFLMVLVIIAMAFMVMFRVQIAPRTVITVQSALPKIAIALILITFSYAIAGLMIDLMYVVIGLLAGIIVNSGIVDGSVGWTQVFNDFTGTWGVFTLSHVYMNIFGHALDVAMLSGGVVLGVLSSVSFLISIIVKIYVALIVIKIVWMLIKNYVMILLHIIIGPVYILIGTLGTGGFGLWLRNMVSYLAVYPITALLFFVSFLFLKASVSGVWAGFFDQLLQTLNWLAPIIGSDRDPFPFGLETATAPLGTDAAWSPPMTIGTQQPLELLWLIVSLVVLSMIPQAAKMAKAFIMGGRFEMRSTIGQGLAVAATPFTYPFARTGGAMMDETTKEMGRRISEQVSKSAGILGKKLQGRR